MTSLQTQTVNAKIVSGAAVTGVIDLAGLELVGIVMSPVWTSAVMTFAVAPDIGGAPGTFVKLTDNAGTEVSYANTVAVGAVAIKFTPNIFKGVRWLKINSGTNASGTNQGADRLLALLTVAEPV